MSARVSIVIPVFNRLDLTRECLSVLGRTAPEAEVIVVDNASTDGTGSFLLAEQERGALRAIVNAENRFFGPACNQGAAAATRELVCFLNNDTIPHAGWLDAMVRCLDDDPAVGAVGSRLLYPDGRVQHAGIVFVDPGIPDHVHRFAPADDPAVAADRDHPAVTGACLLLPRALFHAVGAFDDRYVMYVEDVDLCLRVWDAGRRVRYCASSVLIHLESASSADVSRRDALVREGWGTMHERWGSRWPEAVRALPGWPVRLGGVRTDVTVAGARAFAVGAYADELVAEPELLAAWARTFDAGDDVTLVVLLSPGTSPEALAEAAAAAGLEGRGPDLLAVDHQGDADAIFATALDAVFSRRRPVGPLAALPRYDDRSVDGVRALSLRPRLLVHAA